MMAVNVLQFPVDTIVFSINNLCIFGLSIKCIQSDNEKSPCLQLIRGLAMLNSSSGAVSLRTENSSGSGTFSSEQTN
jgi:hypothetical protein